MGVCIVSPTPKSELLNLALNIGTELWNDVLESRRREEGDLLEVPSLAPVWRFYPKPPSPEPPDRKPNNMQIRSPMPWLIRRCPPPCP